MEWGRWDEMRIVKCKFIWNVDSESTVGLRARIVKNVDVGFFHRIVKNVDSASIQAQKKIDRTWIHRGNLEHLFANNPFLLILHTAHVYSIRYMDSRAFRKSSSFCCWWRHQLTFPAGLFQKVSSNTRLGDQHLQSVHCFVAELGLSSLSPVGLLRHGKTFYRHTEWSQESRWTGDCCASL